MAGGDFREGDRPGAWPTNPHNDKNTSETLIARACFIGACFLNHVKMTAEEVKLLLFTGTLSTEKKSC